VAGTPKRIPGEKNPVASSDGVNHITNASMGSNGEGTFNGIAGRLLGALGAGRARRAKKRAIAEWEAKRRGGG
jgi:hypothetical protein